MQFEVAVERLKTEFGADVQHRSCCRGRPPGAPTPRARPRSWPTPGSTDVFVRGDGTQLAVFPNRFVLERFAQRNPTVRLERLIGADEPV